MQRNDRRSISFALKIRIARRRDRFRIFHDHGGFRRTNQQPFERDKNAKAHVYRAKQAQEQTQKNLVSDLLEKAFRGSALKLVQHVLETKPASAEELKEIRKLIADAEKKNK